MHPPYLSTDRLALRAMVADDALVASDWFPAAFPVNADQAGRWLREQHRTSPWDGPTRLWLAVVRIGEHDPNSSIPRQTVVGGVTMSHPRDRTTDVQIRIAPSIEHAEADGLQAEVIRLLVPWARDELETMVVTVAIGSDQPASVTAAQELGMLPAARLREHLARPGRRADLLWFQALNAGRRIPAVAGAPAELSLVPAGDGADGTGGEGRDA